MNRIEGIRRFKQVRDQKEWEKVNNEQNIVDDYTKQVLGLKSKIEELINVANECIDNDIPLKRKIGLDSKEFYLKETSNGYFNLGFIRNENDKIISVGCQDRCSCLMYQMSTDGNYIMYKYNPENEIKKILLEHFIRCFEKFENEFYNYVDNVIAIYDKEYETMEYIPQTKQNKSKEINVEQEDIKVFSSSTSDIYEDRSKDKCTSNSNKYYLKLYKKGDNPKVGYYSYVKEEVYDMMDNSTIYFEIGDVVKVLNIDEHGYTVENSYMGVMSIPLGSLEGCF